MAQTMMDRKANLIVTSVMILYKTDLRLSLEKHATVNKTVDHYASQYSLGK